MSVGVLTDTTHGTLSSMQEEPACDTELDRLKEELELVSYVASHDLQAPLRIILSYCDILNKHPGLSADKKGEMALKTISREAAHLKTLIQGLLDYLRLETFDPAYAVFDSTEALVAAIATLEDKVQKTAAVITYDTLPPVYGHRGRVTRLFACLIDNALKFCTRPPVIHISAKREGDVWEFGVEDNGIGIAEEYYNTIWTLFQRLHTAEAYPGEGIGLALSRKIVESHRGKIQVTSLPHKGSRFRFTLPVQAEH